MQEILFVLTFQRDDLERWIHDSRVSGNWSSNWIGRISHVNNDNMIRLSNFFSHTDELIRLHCKSAKSDIANIDANIC